MFSQHLFYTSKTRCFALIASLQWGHFSSLIEHSLQAECPHGTNTVWWQLSSNIFVKQIGQSKVSTILSLFGIFRSASSCFSWVLSSWRSLSRSFVSWAFKIWSFSYFLVASYFKFRSSLWLAARVFWTASSLDSRTKGSRLQSFDRI